MLCLIKEWFMVYLLVLEKYLGWVDFGIGVFTILRVICFSFGLRLCVDDMVFFRGSVIFFLNYL